MPSAGMQKEKDSVSKDKTSEQVWENCLKLIRDNVNPQNFKTWFEPIRAVELDASTLTIEVQATSKRKQWIEESISCHASAN